jgi:hypothetical protein
MLLQSLLPSGPSTVFVPHGSLSSATLPRIMSSPHSMSKTPAVGSDRPIELALSTFLLGPLQFHGCELILNPSDRFSSTFEGTGYSAGVRGVECRDKSGGIQRSFFSAYRCTSAQSTHEDIEISMGRQSRYCHGTSSREDMNCLRSDTFCCRPSLVVRAPLGGRSDRVYDEF